MKNDAYSKLFPIIVGFHRQEPIPQQGKSAEDLLEYPSGRNMPSGTAGRVKESEPPVIRSPTSSPSRNHRTQPPPASWKLKLQDALAAIARMLGDFLQHQRNDPVSNSAPTPSRPMLESELDIKWLGQNGEASKETLIY
ncbi:uncharacterized protein [Drosophila suzukii]|uniref:Uncharacterized protein n=1 Tax=Drosophila suzukii TaxID=28584 RepID=A0ABM4TX80_DROSZ|nr:uncharacterized protein LOC118879631 [Drosophila suzukii]